MMFVFGVRAGVLRLGLRVGCGFVLTLGLGIVGLWFGIFMVIFGV